MVRTLIECDGVDEFYVGNHGEFDRKAEYVLKQLSKEYPHIRCAVVWSRTPQTPAWETKGELPVVFPNEVATAIPRFAILTRNRWMLERADVVVTYVKHAMGGSGRFQEMALKQGKRVIRLADIP